MEESPLQESSSGPMGQYYLLDKIAQGGMAEIYKGLAYDLHGIRRTVVIKKILPHVAAHREFIDMLVTEAKLAVQLSHGNIAQVYDLGKVGDDYFMVMEYVDGKSVSQIMRKVAQNGESIPIPIAVHIAAEAAAGLHYMHSRTDSSGKPLNIIHRDVSPQNLMLTSGGTVKIIDFGIAKAATTIEITDVGVVKGKFAYMSPEQATGDPLDWRSDEFSLGVVLFEMLTGRRLFKGKDNQETLRNVRRTNVPRPSMYRDEIPEALDAIVLKSLSKARGARYESAGTLRDDLLKFLHQFHPTFQNADIERYLERIFQDDQVSGRGEESHTPLLIIDRTQSALLESFPIDELPPPPRSSDVSVEPPSASEDEHSEWTPLLIPAQERRRRQTLMLTALVATLCVMAAVGLGFWRYQLLGNARMVFNAPKQVLPVTEVLPSSGPVEVPKVPVQPPPPPPPAEPFGDVVVDSEPKGGEIYLDDRTTGLVTPTTLARLPAGTSHIVAIHMKGYKYWSVPVTIRAGGVERVNVTLEINYASLDIITKPIGAEVIINGRPAGVTPYFQEHVHPDEILKIVVRKEGYFEWTRELRAEQGRLMTLRPVLERDPRATLERRPVVEPSEPAPTVLPVAK